MDTLTSNWPGSSKLLFWLPWRWRPAPPLASSVSCATALPRQCLWCRSQDKYSFYSCSAKSVPVEVPRTGQKGRQGTIRLQKKQYHDFLKKRVLRGAWVLQQHTIKI